MVLNERPGAAPSDIMIVDDNPANLKLLEEMLLQQGHDVRSFPLGRLALAAARKNPPDLILLDINMREMNGYEVCERLKSSPELSAVPVIFLSALTETQDKVKAFRSGGVDYISKPFQFEEVQARVETHLMLHALQRSLQAHNVRLEEAVAARTRELADANGRLGILDRSKSDFLNLISHGMRTPLNGLLGVCDIVLEGMPPDRQNGELLKMFERSRTRILSFLDDALLLAQIDAGADNFSSGAASWQTALHKAMERAADFAESRGVGVSLSSAIGEGMGGDESLLERAFYSLLETAIKFSEKGGTVRVSHELIGESRIVIFQSQGKPVPDASLGKFFDLFSLGEASIAGGTMGLGPALAHRILALFGASVSVTNQDKAGLRLTVQMKDLQ